MDQNSVDQRIKANAYRVFFSELEKHMQDVCATMAPGKRPDSKELRRVGATFHTIRGGAGFFGLEELATTAGQIENLLLQDTKRACADLESVRVLIEQISTITENLPKPDEDRLPRSGS